MKNLREILIQIVPPILMVALSTSALYVLLNALDPQKKKVDAARSKSQKTMARLGLNTRKLKLNEHEEIIAAEIICQEDLKVTFADIGGLQDIIQSLEENVIYPLKHPELFTDLLGPPKGVLLYGLPGNGKTMIAQALAKESSANFINLHVSTLTEKWYGESQKLVKALFSLARKIQPTIIFIDEIDSFLRERSSSDHEATAGIKAEFMTHWDGLASGDQQIIILGATNRLHDIDKAIIRRMPQRYAIGMPGLQQREQVLKLTMKRISMEVGFDYTEIARRTSGYSCSDLRELCRESAMRPIKQQISSARKNNVDGILSKRPVSMNDFIVSIGDNVFLSDSGIHVDPVE